MNRDFPLEERLRLEEDFGQEEDLVAWKFAREAADYWRHKIEELEHVAGFGEAVSGCEARGGG
jgi:hypothetical protein